MVDRADFQSKKDFSKKSRTGFPLAPVSDRFLAVGFDFAIFTPVIGLMLAPLFRRIELVSLSAPQSTEFSVLIGLCVFYICVLVILLQTLFLVWKRATPGQMFFKILVISKEHPNSALTLSQSLLRSFIWTLQFFLALLPFLEVFSDSERRPLHDRAAGTLVVTKKSESEPAPHPFEADMVRKIMIVSYSVLAMWGMFGISHLYKMAMSGDFKRAELVADNYLCAEVTASLGEDKTQSDAVRIDKAVALYLASEVDEECVNSEADFALWSSNDEGSQWAYFAKGLVKKYDKDLAIAYFEKACETDSTSIACELAQFESAQISKSFSNSIQLAELSNEAQSSQTAKILTVTESYDQARYPAAEKEFLDLKETTGFENFSQKGLVKSLWAQNKKEKAEGAFLSTILNTTSDHKEDIAAWLCSEQMSDQCTSKSYESCEILKAEYFKDLRPIEKPTVALALLKDKECRPGAGIEMIRFHDLFKDYPDLLKFAQALSSEENLSATDRLDLLKDLSFRQESVRPKVLRTYALQELAEKSLRKSDLDLISRHLEKKKLKDLVWQSVSEKMKSKILPAADRIPASATQEEP